MAKDLGKSADAQNEDLASIETEIEQVQQELTKLRDLSEEEVIRYEMITPDALFWKRLALVSRLAKLLDRRDNLRTDGEKDA